MPYIFVAATVVSIIPIIILFRVFIERIRANPDNLSRIMVHFFIGIGIAEFIPILLIVLGMVNATPVSDISELYFPGGLIILATGFGVLLIFLQQFGDLKVDTRQFRLISLSLMTGIPIVSIVGLLTMIPQ